MKNIKEEVEEEYFFLLLYANHYINQEFHIS